jgi:sugar lactone lactonase YvrE
MANNRYSQVKAKRVSKGLAAGATGGGGLSTIGSLDFSPSAINETSTITTSSNMSNAPFISAFKEVPQTGVSTKGNWDVNSTASNYDLLDEAPLLYSGVSITPSSATANGTFTLSSGSFASSDIGKRVIGNSGEATIKATDGSYVIHTSFANTNAIGAGGWKLRGLVADSSVGLKMNKSVNAYNIANASYDSVSFSVTSQEGGPNGMCWNNDGTKLFVTGQVGDDVNEYSLTTAYDLSTASYTRVFSVSSQETSPQAIRFSNDGTKMFIVGAAGDDVNQYSLTTGFDVSTASFDNVTFSLASQSTTPLGIAFNNDGTKMFMVGGVTNNIYQYALTTAFDMSTASYDNVLFLADSSYHQYQDLEFNNDGTKLFLIDGAASGTTIKSVAQISLTTAFDLSTASYDNISFSIESEEASPRALLFNNDGTKMYVIGATSDTVFQYSTGDILIPTSQYFTSTTNSGGQIDTESWTDLNSLTADETLNDGATYYAFSTDGRTTWKVQNSSGDLRSIARLNSSTWQYNSSGLTTNGYDISNASYDSVTFSVASQDANPNSIIFNNDGTKLFMYGSTGDAVYEYHLSTAYDLSTMSYDSSLAIAGEASPQSLNFSADGTNLYTLGRGIDTLYQYPLSTAFDVSTAGTRSSYSLAGFDTGPSGIAFKSDGTKMYFVGYGSDNVVQFSLSTAWDITTATSDSVTFSVTTQTGVPKDLRFRPDGTEFYIIGNLSVFKYSLTTAWDLSTASYSNESISVQSQDTTAEGICFNSDGTKMYMVGLANDNIYQYTTGSSTEAFTTAETWVDATYNNQQAALQQALSSRLANRLTGTDLATYSDANLIATGDTFDLMIGLYMGSAGTSPTSDAITISYDGAVQNKGAILGTDYGVEKLSDTQLKFTALTQKNMHFKVI